MRTFIKWTTGIGCTLIVIGIILAGIGFFGGAKIKIGHGMNRSWNKGSYENISQTYKGVDSIYLDVQAATVTLKEGEEFRIEANNIRKGSLTTELEDDTWYIEEGFDYDHGDTWYPRFLRKFHWIRGLDFIEYFDGKNNEFPEITIYVPKGFEASSIDFNVAAGTLYIENLITDEAQIYVAAGTVSCNNLTINHEAEFSVDAGQMSIDNLDASDIDLNVGVGKADIQGSVMGDAAINCDMGSIELDLIGKESDYDFQVDSDVGNVKINGERISRSHTEDYENPEAEYEFEITCSLGSINLTVDK